MKRDKRKFQMLIVLRVERSNILNTVHPPTRMILSRDRSRISEIVSFHLIYFIYLNRLKEKEKENQKIM